MKRLAWIVSATLVGSVLVAGPGATSAWATADLCADGDQKVTCLHVDGDGLYVRSFQPSALWGPNGLSVGHWQLFDGGSTFDSAGGDYAHQSTENDSRAYGDVYRRNRAYDPGQQICAIYWYWLGEPGKYENRGKVCVDLRQ